MDLQQYQRFRHPEGIADRWHAFHDLVSLDAMGAAICFEKHDGLPMTVTGAQLKPLSWDTRSGLPTPPTRAR